MNGRVGKEGREGQQSRSKDIRSWSPNEQEASYLSGVIKRVHKLLIQFNFEVVAAEVVQGFVWNSRQLRCAVRRVVDEMDALQDVTHTNCIQA